MSATARNSARLALAAAAVATLVACRPGTAAAASRTWSAAADFADGVRYGVTATGTAPLTLGIRRTYDTDSECCLGSGFTYWTTANSGSPLDAGLADHLSFAIGDYLYVVGGRRDPGANACQGSAARIVSAVQYARFRTDGSVTEWLPSAFSYGQSGGGVAAVPIYATAAVVIGKRVYVAGGKSYADPNNPGQGETLLNRVYSSEQDPATGALGPWRLERPVMPQAVFGHAMAYVGGSVFILGGASGQGVPGLKTVQRAAVNPLGYLAGTVNVDRWDLIPDMPPGPPNQNPCTNTAACSGLCETTDCPGSDDTACRGKIGWCFTNAFSVQRSIGFVGGAFIDGLPSPCKFYEGEGVGVLNDCNEISWTLLPKLVPSLRVSPRGGIGLADDLLLVAGGLTDSNTTTVNVVFPPIVNSGCCVCSGGGCSDAPVTGQSHAIMRDPGSPDRASLRPAPFDGVNLVNKGYDTGGQRLAQSLAVATRDAPLVLRGDFAYLVGGSVESGVVCNRIYRAWIPSATWFTDRYMEAGYYLSPPVDLGAEYKLSRVSWRYAKQGASPDDDWIMVRYRVAGADLTWGYEGCAGGWTPRVPDVGTMPSGAGLVEYDSALGANHPRAMPLFATPVRYVQFEVSLFNDGTNDCPGPASPCPAPTLPEFKEFRIEYEPFSVPPPSFPSEPLLVYPSVVTPAACALTVQFTLTPSGGEAHARVYNSAGRLAAKGDWRYGPQAGQGAIVAKETIDVCGFAPGAYVVVVTATGTDGRPGLVDVSAAGGAALERKVAKFVVRR